jgi:hypothetical protein
MFGKGRGFVETAGGKLNHGFNLFAIEAVIPLHDVVEIGSRLKVLEYDRETGIRVPFNTRAPITLPGMLSTAAHCDQSSPAIEGTPVESITLLTNPRTGRNASGANRKRPV